MSRHPTVPILLGLLAGAAVLLLAATTPGEAEEADKREIVYIAITGQGPTAKAWYRGAPPTGEEVQPAFDRFGARGFRVTHVAASNPTTVLQNQSAIDNLDEQYFIVVLEKP